MFGQTFQPHDLIIIGLLVILEGVLSIDNALVLGLLARRLPKRLQGKALTYGLVGALVFRLLAVAMASYLLHWRLVKLLGGGYLLWVALRHFFFEQKPAVDEKVSVDAEGQPIPVDEKSGEPVAQEKLAEEMSVATQVRGIDFNHADSTHTRAFWWTVLAIELTDIAFAVDSIVAAIGVVGAPPHNQRHPKLWVVLIGGMLGVVLMRFAAVVFIKLLEKFPRFETSAYLLVTIIGAKLVADWAFNSPVNPNRLNFHDPDTVTFWIFWGLMLASFLFGLIPPRSDAKR